jgi:serine/threonine-protein kinase SRPK3
MYTDSDSFTVVGLPHLFPLVARTNRGTDIHLGNALLRLPSDILKLSDEEIHIKYDPPEPEAITRADGKPLAVGVPSHATPAIWLGADSEGITFSEAKLLLSDFGAAFNPAKESRFDSFTPWMIQPPEARFESSKPLSFPSDIWGLGFAVWTIFGQRPLHDSFLFSRDDALADQVDALGPLPPEWWKQWEARSKRFTDDGQPKDGRFVWTWDARFEDSVQEPRRREGMELVRDEEKIALYELVRGTLRYRPEDRWSIKQVLGSSWMQNWGLPTLNAR